MRIVDIYRDAYPEQLMAALRDEIRRAERVERTRDEAQQRRRERRAARRVGLTRWMRRMSSATHRLRGAFTR